MPVAGIKDARNKSSPSRMRFLGRTGGNSTEASFRRSPLHGFYLVSDSLLSESMSGVAPRQSWKIAGTGKEISGLRVESVNPASVGGPKHSQSSHHDAVNHNHARPVGETLSLSRTFRDLHVVFVPSVRVFARVADSHAATVTNHRVGDRFELKALDTPTIVSTWVTSRYSTGRCEPMGAGR